MLQSHVLEPLLGIDNPRTINVFNLSAVLEVQMNLKTALGGVLHLKCIRRLDELFTIADAGEVMPPKSTWFEPKLRMDSFTCLIP